MDRHDALMRAKLHGAGELTPIWIRSISCDTCYNHRAEVDARIVIG